MLLQLSPSPTWLSAVFSEAMRVLYLMQARTFPSLSLKLEQQLKIVSKALKLQQSSGGPEVCRSRTPL